MIDRIALSTTYFADLIHPVFTKNNDIICLEPYLLNRTIWSAASYSSYFPHQPPLTICLRFGRPHLLFQYLVTFNISFLITKCAVAWNRVNECSFVGLDIRLVEWVGEGVLQRVYAPHSELNVTIVTHDIVAPQTSPDLFALFANLWRSVKLWF